MAAFLPTFYSFKTSGARCKCMRSLVIRSKSQHLDVEAMWSVWKETISQHAASHCAERDSVIIVCGAYSLVLQIDE